MTDWTDKHPDLQQTYSEFASSINARDIAVAQRFSNASNT